MIEKVAAIKEQLGLDIALNVKAAVEEANESMGLEASETIAEQVGELIHQLGVTSTLASPPTLIEKVAAIKQQLGLDASLNVKVAVQEANEIVGLEASGTVAEQVAELLYQLGINLTPAPAAAYSLHDGESVTAAEGQGFQKSSNPVEFEKAYRESVFYREELDNIQSEVPEEIGFTQGMFSCAACACTEKMPSSGTLPASGVPLDVNHSRDIFSEAVAQRWASGPPRAPPQRGGNITGTMPIEATGALPGEQFIEPESGVAGIPLSTHTV